MASPQLRGACLYQHARGAGAQESQVKISELIKLLEQTKAEDGDINVFTQSLTHLWAPELKVRRLKSGAPDYLVLNS